MWPRVGMDETVLKATGGEARGDEGVGGYAMCICVCVCVCVCA